MNKIILLFLITGLLMSCSNSDDGGEVSTHKISFKLDGEINNYDNVVVASENEGTYLRVEASNANNTISFLLFDESPADHTFSGFDLVEDGNTNYYHQSEGFTSNVTVINMNGGRLKGNFSGILMGFDSNGNLVPERTITNGQFDFTY